MAALALKRPDLDLVPAVVVITDGRDRIRYVNPAAAAARSVAPADLIGLTVVNVAPGGTDHERRLRAEHDVKRTGEPYREIERWREPGRRVWYRTQRIAYKGGIFAIGENVSADVLCAAALVDCADHERAKLRRMVDTLRTSGEALETTTTVLAERALEALVRCGMTVTPGPPLQTDIEQHFADVLRETTDPARLARAVGARPELLASLCIRVIRARR